ncbi:lysophospholipid acyltransferase family protein [Saxibacter everestensis]|uniref:Lysophospholipid acyltransferase family protein n=1 Tax=Saxibacter everestensis TaxID=2909229 RepID=A0ABY8QTD1_9MICO|nr:lysophospholipid acyltransferase family protein [Brevibacteriaceae bacterium ZFBP1038]
MLGLLRVLILAPLFRVAFRPTVIGRRNVPRRGPVIIASNHLSFIDSVVLTLLAPRRVAFLAKSEYFTGRGLKGWISRTFFTAVGAIPVDRGAIQAARDSLKRGQQTLEAGHAFAIYPEGTRSRDGRLYKGRTGVGWLATATGAPIVPVALAGTENLQPVGKRWLRRAKVTVKFGNPIWLQDIELPQAQAQVRRALTDAVMGKIHGLSGQELADSYNVPPNKDAIEG